MTLLGIQERKRNLPNGTVGSQQVTVLVCDSCGHECWNEPSEAYARYVPSAWKADGGQHICPDCQENAS